LIKSLFQVFVAIAVQRNQATIKGCGIDIVAPQRGNEWARNVADIVTRNFLLKDRPFNYRYREVDPDVFGEELLNPAYRDVERIAAVVLCVSRNRY